MPAKIKITNEQRRQIKILAGYGMSDDDIALVIDISEATIKRRCRKELDMGRALSKSLVQQTAYKMAVSGKCPAMTIFWLKTQCHWREMNNEDKKDNGAAPISNVTTITNDPVEASRIYQQFMK